MYHDTIHINFKNFGNLGDVGFDYNFLISKSNQDKFSPVKYGELLQKFDNIGFDTKYIKFNDIDSDDTIVYCTYNYQPNFDIFFSAYRKLLQYKKFSLTFEYGVIIGGKFYINSMNGAAGLYFVDSTIGEIYKEEIFKGKIHQKTMEIYRLINKDGIEIHSELTEENRNFEQHFFENYNVKVACRKYKLGRLKRLSFLD